MTDFRVIGIKILDPDDDKTVVTRYALVEPNNLVWINGHSFGFTYNMACTDHSSRDCRHLFRKTPEDAAKDSRQWYDLVLIDNRYRVVER